MTEGSGGSLRRASLTLGIAVLASNLAQIAWLALGRDAFPAGRFGIVLAAQSLYGVLQIILDNGASWEGARLTAAGRLTSNHRVALVRARCLLAGFGIAVMVVVGVAGDTRLLVASAPFMAALLLFALLNVWEPLGGGDMRPFATYIGGRTIVLALLVGVCSALGVVLPLTVPGLVECGVIVLVAVVSRQRLPRLRFGTGGLPLPWGVIARIGAPAVIAQYDYALGTVLLGATGRAAAAAVAGVSLRLVSGLSGFNGVLSTAIFPRLARTRAWRPSDIAVAGITLATIVLLSVAGLAAMILLAPPIASGFLGHDNPATRSALIVGFSAAAGAGVIAQLVLVLVAVHAERKILRASVAGAIVLSLATLPSAFTSQRHAAVVVAAAFAGGQALTALMLSRTTWTETECPRWTLVLSGASSCLLPVIAACASLVPAIKPGAVALLVLLAGALAWRIYAYARQHLPSGSTQAVPAGGQEAIDVAEPLELWPPGQ